MNISHVCFDFAGTLYKETPEFNALHDQFRIETYAKLVGVSDLVRAKQEFLALYHKHGSNSAVFKALGQQANYWMQALDSMDFKSVLHPDLEVSDTLFKLAEKVPLSLFTNFDHQRINELLEYLKIPHTTFSVILSGDDITERKPALDGFHAVIDRSKVPAKQILYVGDRVDADIKPAKLAGMQTALIYKYSPEADFCIKNFKDLLQLF